MDVTVRGHVVQISECDAEIFYSRKWQVYRCRTGRLRLGRSGGNYARIIMNCPQGMHVDHINGNALDNRRENLRICTHQQNQWNRKKAPGISLYKGVTHFKDALKPWMARVECNGVRKSYGSYRTQLEAAFAYDEAAVRLFGEYAAPNFPERFRNRPLPQEVT